MSYNVNLPCECTVYVSCHPLTQIAHTRILERRAPTCRHRRHETGARVWLWEMLPTPSPATDAFAGGSVEGGGVEGGDVVWVGDGDGDVPPASIEFGTSRHHRTSSRDTPNMSGR